MRSLLTLVGAAVVTFAVAGWFLGWYKVRTTPGPDGHREVTIDVNGPKIQEDLKKGEARILNATQRAPTASTNPAAPPSFPPLPLPGTQTSSSPAPTPPGQRELPLPQGAATAPPTGTTFIQPAPNGSVLALPNPPQ